MKPNWLLARYVRDLRRREPINVGVVLYYGDQVLSRFLGETDDNAKIDGRRARRVRNTDIYSDWVDQWRREIAAATPVAELLKKRADDNFFLERGGEVFLGEVAHPDQFLLELYRTLVERDDKDQSSAEPDFQDALFDALGGTSALERYPTIDVGPDRFTFDFRVRAAPKDLFRIVTLNGSERHTWEAIHATVQSVSVVGEKTDYRPHALITERDPGPMKDRQLEALQMSLGERAHPVRDAAQARELVDKLVA